MLWQSKIVLSEGVWGDRTLFCGTVEVFWNRRATSSKSTAMVAYSVQAGLLMIFVQYWRWLFESGRTPAGFPTVLWWRAETEEGEVKVREDRSRYCFSGTKEWESHVK